MYGSNGQAFCPWINDNGIASSLIRTNGVAKRHIGASAVSNAKVASGTLSLGGGTDGAVIGKLNGRYVTCTFTATTAKTVTHGLGRAPIGFIPVWISGKGATIRLATTALVSSFQSTIMKVRPSATCTAKLWVF